MNNLKYFSNFLLIEESKSIPDICIEYTNYIFNIIKNNILEFKNSNDIIISISKPNINLLDSRLPLKEIFIQFNFNKIKGIKNFIEGIFDGTNSKIKDNEYIECRFNFNINIGNFSLIEKDIKSAILHELTHCYEKYNLDKGNKFKPFSWNLGNINTNSRTIFKYITDFQNIIYYTLKHELRSIISELYIELYYSDIKYINKENIINELYKTKVYNNIFIKLKKFNINNIIEQIEKDNVIDEFILEINYFNKYVYNSIIDNMSKNNVNKNYLNDINNSIWNKKINNFNDLKLFLYEIQKSVDFAIKYLNKKFINVINKIENDLKTENSIKFEGKLKYNNEFKFKSYYNIWH
jgi:hypothetical protein